MCPFKLLQYLVLMTTLDHWALFYIILPSYCTLLALPERHASDQQGTQVSPATAWPTPQLSPSVQAPVL